MMEHDIVARLHELLLSIIPSPLTGQRDIVLRLAEAHMAHGPHGVGGLIEVSRVAQQCGSPMNKVDMSLDDLRVGVGAVHVELQLVGMDKIDPVVHRLALAWRCQDREHTKCKEA